MGQQGSKDPDVASSVKAGRNRPGDVKGGEKENAETGEAMGSVGSEARQAARTQKERWGRVEEGDTLWSLSEKYLGDATQWETLQTACRRELGADPLLLLPGSHVTEACVARARSLVKKL